MAFSKPFSPDEQKYILKAHASKNYGQIASELAVKFADWNGGERSPDGVKEYIRRYESEYVGGGSVRVSRSHKQAFQRLGLDPVDVEFIISACVTHTLDVIGNGQTSNKSPKKGLKQGSCDR